MPLSPSFPQYDFNMEVTGEQGEKLKSIIRGSWNAKTRDKINKIAPADEWEGNVYSITLDDDRSPPTIGGFVEGIVRHGWGYLYFDENNIYVAPILESQDRYYFEGRKDAEFDLPPIRKVPDIEIDEEMPLDNRPRRRDQRRIQSLRDDLLEVWPNETLESIKNITYSTGSSNSYIINTENNNVTEKDEDGNLKFAHREIPDSPLGKHVDALLKKGWAVCTIKSNSLFVSRIKGADPVSHTRNAYQFEGDGDLVYEPKVCDVCGEHEDYQMLVTDTEEPSFSEGYELPVYTRACKSCIEESEYPTEQEYRDEQRASEESDI